MTTDAERFAAAAAAAKRQGASPPPAAAPFTLYERMLSATTQKTAARPLPTLDDLGKLQGSARFATAMAMSNPPQER